MIPISTLIFVSLFAFGEDAIHDYSRFFNWIRNHCVPRWPGDRALAPVAAAAQTNELPPLRFCCPTSTQITTQYTHTIGLTGLAPTVDSVSTTGSSGNANRDETYEQVENEVEKGLAPLPSMC
ncbi:hypothetical protein D9619_012761 [Psilocybe cf. subviscida]|uniref:Secreted protein n=1 Tax=Psilocybe cf. subviscida TaxID=2480587 RepID=A0A8H5AR93_9AGAR|nr:hypothetical protein D9619_012761 [Psilocybe cf. subviscida]